MKFQFTDDPPYPRGFGVERWWSTTPDENGIVEVPEDHEQYEEIVERCKELDRLEAVDPEGSDGDDTPPEPDMSQYTEDDIVGMDYREMQSLAGRFDGIKGNASEGELEEALILKVRNNE
jgi:soluble cytochrome b562